MLMISNDLFVSVLQSPIVVMYFLTAYHSICIPLKNATFDLFCSEKCQLATVVANRYWLIVTSYRLRHAFSGNSKQLHRHDSVHLSFVYTVYRLQLSQLSLQFCYLLKYDFHIALMVTPLWPTSKHADESFPASAIRNSAIRKPAH